MAARVTDISSAETVPDSSNPLQRPSRNSAFQCGTNQSRTKYIPPHSNDRYSTYLVNISLFPPPADLSLIFLFWDSYRNELLRQGKGARLCQICMPQGSKLPGDTGSSS